MIEIEHDGRKSDVTGWRAWIIGAVAVVGTGVILIAVGFLLLGIAISLVWFFAILIPVVVVIGLVAMLFRPRAADR